MSTLSPFSQLMNEEKVAGDGEKQAVSEDDDKKSHEDGEKQTVLEDDDKKLDESTQIKNDVIYDYLPQGRIFIYYLTYKAKNINSLFTQHTLDLTFFQIMD